MGTTNVDAVDLSLLEPIFEKYQDQKGALIPILQNAQDIYGFLPREVLQRIADRQRVSLGKVYGVATFYAQFHLERRGRHILKLCDGTACHVKGAPLLQASAEDEFGITIGETTQDGELTIETIYCLGSCALAPVAVLDDVVMGEVRREKLIREIKKVIKGDM
ncbi:MAG: NAD(P)H-dependent oxidoreductase subunit E [Anaerolineaceae bacterium]|nr:NAD(P)H-dependent oxidoreductase subunit E [Anaerolineaceae bacterium]